MRPSALAVCLTLPSLLAPPLCQAQQEAPLPQGARAVWDLASAQRDATPARERVCINGLWRWQPGRPGADAVPTEGWGYFKVPGAWPGVEDWLQKDCQTVVPHPSWADAPLADVTAAWYQREVTLPAEWAGRRIALRADYVNSYAVVYLDGAKAGEIRFPSGELDLSGKCQANTTCMLSIRVIALPLSEVVQSYGDTASVKQVPGSVARRGLCGDVWLEGAPAGPRLNDAKIDTSVRRWEITFEASLADLPADGRYTLRAEVTGEGGEAVQFTSQPFGQADLREGRFSFAAPWKPARLWDLHTPGNTYTASLTLLDAGGKAADTTYPARFGFRELWIEGRDFYLNGSRIYLSAVPLDNAQIGAARASYEGARESLERLKSFGINFVYTHNYDCRPGSFLSFEEELRAADDAGVLVALTQPHFGDYEWKAADADQTNGYARHAEFFCRVAQNHPSVVFYSMSHNATGYSEDMNPDMIDGLTNPRESWAENNAKLAVRAAAIVERMDPARIVYHHSSGNLGPMHTTNFYTNFAPIQELSDWFEHWATVGQKPVFTCEYMVPCTWDWTMYRGWYKGNREFGSATVPWDFSIAEWNSQFVGDAAFRSSEPEKTNIRWEAQQFREGNLWHRWDYPFEVGSEAFDERYPIIGAYLYDNWRAFRTWGVSATSPWEWGHYWKPREGVDRSRQELPVDWEHLQRPGYSADYIQGRYERIDLAFGRDDWVATPAAQALLRNNMPLLGYIAGKPSAFTSKDHLYYPADAVEKQLIVINNSREPVTCECAWSLALPEALTGSHQVSVETGQQERVPLRLELPAGLAPGTYELSATFGFGPGREQKDTFAIRVLKRPAAVGAVGRIALFDPKGDTAALLKAMDVPCERVPVEADLAGHDVVIIGRGALTPDGPAPDLARVRDGLKVLVFEQSAEALEKRLGFRVAEYGLRQAFPRIPDHPLLAGLDADALRDWRGEATLQPARLEYDPSPTFNGAPTVRWCGIEVSHVWRCGNRGNVASVLIEKPARGDFLPIVDGGYSLQYSPLLEYREGQGMVLFCQMDVTGRTDSDPAAETLACNLLRYAAEWRPAPRRSVTYAGDAAGLRHLERCGIAPSPYDGGALSPDRVLVVGPGGPEALKDRAAAGAFLNAGGHIVALGLSEAEANAFLPTPVAMTNAEHIATFFDPPGASSPLAGIGPADVHNRDPRELPLVTGGAEPLGDGVLAVGEEGTVVFCQLPPWTVTSSEGAVASFAVDDSDAVDGTRSALVTMGAVSRQGGQFGQRVETAPEVGKSYTFAASVKAVGQPVTLHLEVERAGRPWDRAVKGGDVRVGADAWTEVHTTFAVDKPFAEGWQAYIGCAQEGGVFRADAFRLYQGEYDSHAVAPNLIVNPSFEEGEKPWFFQFGEQYNLRKTYRRTSFALTRLLANLGAAGETPLLQRFGTPGGGLPGEAAPEPSVVRNGDFSVDADGDGMPDEWQFAPDTPDSACTREQTDGQWALRIDLRGYGGKDEAGVMLAQHDVPMRDGQWYEVSLRAKGSGFGGKRVPFTITNIKVWQSFFDYQYFAPTEEWKTFRFVVRSSGGAEGDTRLQIWHSVIGTLWLSDIAVVPIPPPDRGRWSEGLYLDQPEEWDDPYRFFRW